MTNIQVQTVPNDEIKLRKGFTGADWWWDPDGTLQVRIASEILDPDWRTALALHEVSEAFLCRRMGIMQGAVDAYDKKYQQEHAIDLNAGDEPDAPYRIPHTFATAIERIYAGATGIQWKTYDDFLAKI